LPIATLKHTVGKTQFVAHRGYREKYPENSLIGVQAAIDAQAKFVEIDIQYSADRQAVIYHDSTLKRVSAIDKPLHQHTLSELLTFPAYEPQRFAEKYRNNTIDPLTAIIPLLKQNPDVQLFVEVKQESIDRLGYEFISMDLFEMLFPIQNQTIIISFDIGFIQYVAANSNWRTGAVIEALRQIHQPPVSDIHPEFIFFDHQLTQNSPVNPPFDTQLVVYEVTDRNLAETLMKKGNYWLESFNAPYLQTLFF